MKTKTALIQPQTTHKTDDHKSLPNKTLTPGKALLEGRLERNAPTWLKRQVFARYGLLWAHRLMYDVDHLVPLCLGGTNDLENLWPHSWKAPYTPRHKCRLESVLRRLVAKGMLSLREAQDHLMQSWVVAFRRFLGER